MVASVNGAARWPAHSYSEHTAQACSTQYLLHRRHGALPLAAFPKWAIMVSHTENERVFRPEARDAARDEKGRSASILREDQ